MSIHLFRSDTEFADWLAQTPSEDELRGAYVQLETGRANLWQPGHIDSFRHDRFDLDARYVTRLVDLKWALTNHWRSSGQFDRFERSPRSTSSITLAN